MSVKILSTVSANSSYDDLEKSSISDTESYIEKPEIDFLAFYEQKAGCLVVDPKEARVQYGDEIASKLKLSEDGTAVLWPQPSDDPEDPQNWTSRRKAIQLFVITLAAIVPDFDSGIGIADVFALAKQYNTTTGVINNLTSNWSIFLLGWGGVFAVMFMRRYGRLPVLFWSQLIAVGFLVGCTFAPNLNTFAAMRCLSSFFATCPQVAGLYIVTDIYPFHMQASKLNLWTMGFIMSPFVSPFAFGFLVARADWRWTYGIACMYSAIVVLAIAFFGEETLYDRSLRPVPERTSSGLRYRIETLLGVTGIKMAKYRPTVLSGAFTHMNVIWRPHIAGLLLFEAILFGFGVGVNVTNTVFFGSAPPLGFGFSQFQVAGLYATPVVATIFGELVGRYLNRWLQAYSIRQNGGVFEAESRLWVCYVAMPLYVAGFVILGAGIQNHLSVATLVIGWGLAQVATMLNTAAVYAYCGDAFPKHQGEVSALINLTRTLGGFGVAFFQVPWATASGALQVLGVEAIIVVVLFLAVVPALQVNGSKLRERFSI